jgi:hypothetical protein
MGRAKADLCARHELELDPGTIRSLVECFGLRFPEEPIAEPHCRPGGKFLMLIAGFFLEPMQFPQAQGSP